MNGTNANASATSQHDIRSSYDVWTITIPVEINAEQTLAPLVQLPAEAHPRTRELHVRYCTICFSIEKGHTQLMNTWIRIRKCMCCTSTQRNLPRVSAKI